MDKEKGKGSNTDDSQYVSQNRGAGMKVFIVDDSAEVRKRIIAMLAELQMVGSIEEAENVQDAIRTLQGFIPDVVILDIQMPGGSGIDVLTKIEKKDHVPVVIMLTNYPYPQYRRKCMDAGADFFFDKSNEFDRVAEVVSSMSRT
jgi:DNA-binding NarL/FixJ family response regulator